MAFADQVINGLDATQRADADAKLEREAEQYGNYFPTLLVGLGGTGAKVLQRVRRLTIERFGSLQRLRAVRYLSIDTDLSSVNPDISSREAQKKDPIASLVRFSEGERINLNAPLTQYTGANLREYPHIRAWLDPIVGDLKLNLPEGAGQIRPAARIAAFHNMYENARIYDTLKNALDGILEQDSAAGDRVNKSRVNIWVVGSLAGGTGAGVFLDITAALRAVAGARNATIIGTFVLPNVFAKVEGALEKTQANGYACLTELNHHLEHPFEARWSANRDLQAIHPLFDRVFLFDKVNESNERLASPEDAYRIIGDNIFSEFFQGQFAAYKRSVRVNRDQYLLQIYTKRHRVDRRDQEPILVDAERYHCQFQSFGMSRVAFPAWRLLNACSYLLAQRVVNFLDDPRPITADEVRLRGDFARQAGFFQGDVEVDRVRSRMWQVCSRLGQLTTDTGAVTTLREEIATEIAKLRDPDWARAVREENAVTAEIEAIHQRLAQLWANPSGEGIRGPRPKQVETNRLMLVREVSAALPSVIEAFCDDGRVGPSRVGMLLASLVEEIKQAPSHYVKQLQEEASAAEARATQAQKEYETRKARAGEAHGGLSSKLLLGERAYLDVLAKVAESLEVRWQAVCDQKVYTEAIAALQEISNRLTEAQKEQDALGRDLQQLGAYYATCAEYYGQSDAAPCFEELDPGQPAAAFLLDYIGRTEGEQRIALNALFRRVRGALGISSNAALLRRHREDREKLTFDLREQCWVALRGEKGVTTWFNSEDGESKTAFIERNSVLQSLVKRYGAPDAPALVSMIQATFRKSKPWINPTERIASVQGLTDLVKRDCFISLYQGGDDTKVAGVVKEGVKQLNDSHFKAQFVQGSDPSEIIFYTETTAFIPAYLGSLSDLAAAYKASLAKRNLESALHIDRNFARYARLLPLEPRDIDGLSKAWNLLVRGAMVGVLRTRPSEFGGLRVPRFYFSENKGGTVFDHDLGTIEQTIELLNGGNPTLAERLSTDIGRAWGRARAHPVAVVALCRYYRLCLFPAVRHAGGVGLHGENRASLGFLAAEELEREAKLLARLDDAALEDQVVAYLRDLPGFTRLLGFTPRDVSALAPGAGENYTERPAGLDRADILQSVRRMLPPEVLGQVWELAECYPWLSLDLARLDAGATAQPVTPVTPVAAVTPPSLSAGPKWYFTPDGANQEELAEETLVARIVAAPNGTNRVWKTGMPDWAGWKDVPELRAKVEAAMAPKPPSLGPPPLGGPPPLRAGPPPLAKPRPVLPEAAWYLAEEGGEPESVGSAALVARIAARPDAKWKVWKEGLADWAEWRSVAEVRAAVEG